MSSGFLAPFTVPISKANECVYPSDLPILDDSFTWTYFMVSRLCLPLHLNGMALAEIFAFLSLLNTAKVDCLETDSKFSCNDFFCFLFLFQFHPFTACYLKRGFSRFRIRAGNSWAAHYALHHIVRLRDISITHPINVHFWVARQMCIFSHYRASS